MKAILSIFLTLLMCSLFITGCSNELEIDSDTSGESTLVENLEENPEDNESGPSKASLFGKYQIYDPDFYHQNSRKLWKGYRATITRLGTFTASLIKFKPTSKYSMLYQRNFGIKLLRQKKLKIGLRLRPKQKTTIYMYVCYR